jgi:hypothetical protein
MDQQQKDREVITMLVSILKGNPYSEGLKTMGQLEDTDDSYFFEPWSSKGSTNL